jgi:hypothetical protein
MPADRNDDPLRDPITVLMKLMPFFFFLYPKLSLYKFHNPLNRHTQCFVYSGGWSGLTEAINADNCAI